jgi:hypothetical protein
MNMEMFSLTRKQKKSTYRDKGNSVLHFPGVRHFSVRFVVDIVGQVIENQNVD